MGAKISILPPKKGFFTPKNNFSTNLYFFPSNLNTYPQNVDKNRVFFLNPSLRTVRRYLDKLKLEGRKEGEGRTIITQVLDLTPAIQTMNFGE